MTAVLLQSWPQARNSQANSLTDGHQITLITWFSDVVDGPLRFFPLVYLRPSIRQPWTFLARCLPQKQKMIQ